jgi:hypothetical protein
VPRNVKKCSCRKTAVANSSAIKVAAGTVYRFHLPYSSNPQYIQKEGGAVLIKTDNNEAKMPAKMGWLRHVLTVLSVVIFVSFSFLTIRLYYRVFQNYE